MMNAAAGIVVASRKPTLAGKMRLKLVDSLKHRATRPKGGGGRPANETVARRSFQDG